MSNKIPEKPVGSSPSAPAVKPSPPPPAQPAAEAPKGTFLKDGAPATPNDSTGFQDGGPDAAGGLAPPPPPPPTEQSLIDQLRTVFQDVKVDGDNKNKLNAGLKDIVNAIVKKNYSGAAQALSKLVGSDATADILKQISDSADAHLEDGELKTLLKNLDAFANVGTDPDFQAAIGKLTQAKSFSDVMAVLKGLPKNDNVRQAVIVLICLDPTVNDALSKAGFEAGDLRQADAAAPSLITAAQALRNGNFKATGSSLMDAVAAAPDLTTKLIAKAAGTLPDGAVKTFLTDDRYKDLIVEVLSDKTLYQSFGQLFSKDGKTRLAGLGGLAKNKGLRDAVIDAIAGDDKIKGFVSPPLTMPDDLKAAGDAVPQVIDAAGKLRGPPRDVKGCLAALGQAYVAAPGLPNVLIDKIMPQEAKDAFKTAGLSTEDWERAGKTIPDLFDLQAAIKSGDHTAMLKALGNAGKDSSAVTAKLLSGFARSNLDGPAKAILGDTQVATILVGGDPQLYRAVADLFTGSKDDKVNALSTILNDSAVRQLAKVALKQAGFDVTKLFNQIGVQDIDIALHRQTSVDEVPAGGVVPPPPAGKTWVMRTSTSTNAEDLGLDVPKINVGGGVTVGVGANVDHASAKRVTIMRAETPDQAKTDVADKRSDAVKPKDLTALQKLNLGKGGFVEWSGDQSFLTGVHGSVGFGAGGVGINITGQAAMKYSGPMKFRLTQTDDTGKNFALTVDMDKKNTKVEAAGVQIDPIPNFGSGAVAKVLPVVKKTMELGIQRQWAQSQETTEKLSGTVSADGPSADAINGVLNNDATSAVYLDQFAGSGVQLNGMIRDVQAKSKTDTAQLTKFLSGKSDVETVQALQEQLDGNQIDIQGSMERHTDSKHMFSKKQLTDQVQFFYQLDGKKRPLPTDLKPLPPHTAQLAAWPQPAGTVGDIKPLVTMSLGLNDTNASGIKTLKDLDRYEMGLLDAGVPPSELGKLDTLRKGVRAGIYPDPKVWPAWLGNFFTDVGLMKRNEPFSLNLDMTAGVSQSGIKKILSMDEGQWRENFIKSYVTMTGKKETDGDTKKAADHFVATMRDAKAYYLANMAPPANGQSNLYNQPEQFAEGAEAKFKAIIGDKSNLPAQLAFLKMAGSQNTVVHTNLNVPDDVGRGMLQAGAQRVQAFFAVQQALTMGARMSTYQGAGNPHDNPSRWYSLDFPKGVDPAVAQEVSNALFGNRIKPSVNKDGSIHFTGNSNTERNADLQKILQNARVVNGQTVLPINWSAKDVQQIVEKVFGKNHAAATLTPGVGSAISLNNQGMQFMSVRGAIKDAFPQLFAHGEVPQIATTNPLGKDVAQVDFLRGLAMSHVGVDATDLDALMFNDDLANPKKDLAPTINMSKPGDIQADQAEEAGNLRKRGGGDDQQ